MSELRSQALEPKMAITRMTMMRTMTTRMIMMIMRSMMSMMNMAGCRLTLSTSGRRAKIRQ
eukprot:5213484-Lingulodinium_polyedra.AAC.1